MPARIAMSSLGQRLWITLLTIKDLPGFVRICLPN